MNKTCTNCNSENVDEAKFCRKCGKQEFKNDSYNADKAVDDILNARVETNDSLDSTDIMIKEFDKQFRKCIAQQILPNNYFVVSGIVRDKSLGEDYIITISNMELCLMQSDKVVQTYQINDKTWDNCEQKAYEITGEYIAGKNQMFFGMIPGLSVFYIFITDYSVLNIIFIIIISILIYVTLVILNDKSNEKKLNLFHSRLITFIENNY